MTVLMGGDGVPSGDLGDDAREGGAVARRALDELAALPGVQLSVGGAVPERYRRDWTTTDPVTPLALARPRDTAEVAAIVRVCARHRVPIVPQGGLTGLCGGATPVEAGLALSLERLTGIEGLDDTAGTMTVRSGTPLAVVQDAAEAAGLFFPLDLGARGSCTIGGNIATNAGGNRVIRYGMTRDMILGLEVVLPDGTVLDAMNSLVKNNAGYDLKQLFIGSEGTLGIITRAVLRLQPLPAHVAAAFCGLPSFEAVLRLLRAARRELGPMLSAFEVMWPDFYDLMTEHAAGVRRPLAGRHARYVLLETHGHDERGDALRLEAFLGSMLDAGVLEDGAVAQSRGDVRDFWRLRDAVADFDQLLGPHVGLDVSLETATMDSFVAEAGAAIEARFPGARSVAFGHVGDGNIHIVVHAPGHVKPPKAEVQEIVFAIVRAKRGSISAEHGIGTSRRAFLGHSRNPAEIALMRTLKHALDPAGIVNPGKLLPLP